MYRDIFLFHWKEETTHAMLDEMEWPLVDKKMSPSERDKAVDDVIDLVGDVDGILKAQSAADVDYFSGLNTRTLTAEQAEELKSGTHQAYRWQYILSGVEHPRFISMLGALTTEEQRKRLTGALSSLL